LTVGLGVALGHFNVFSVAHVPVLTKYVFHVALPCLVARGIGIGVDFYSEAFIWEYIGSFILLRGVALAVSVAVVGHRTVLVALRLRAPESPSRLPELAAEPLEQQRCAGQTVTVLGDVTVVWLNATWISTVILGIPILTAVFGTPKLGAFYGLLAGISSFIFQLPFMLAMLEGHALVLKLRAADGMVDDNAVPDCAAPRRAAAGGEASATVGVVGSVAPPDGNPQTTEWEILLRRNVVWRVLTKVAVNPVMWGIAGGFVISLSTLGERYLRARAVNTSMSLASLRRHSSGLGTRCPPCRSLRWGCGCSTKVGDSLPSALQSWVGTCWPSSS
jgi:predicted permease